MAFDAISRTMYGTQPEVVQPPGDDACLSIVDIATGAVTPYFFYKVGSAYVFGRDFGGTESWGLEEKLDDSVVSLSAFGESVSISGATVAVGAGGRRTVEVWDPLPADAATYCTAGTSVSGCRAVLSACGVSSASAASGFWLRANRVEGAKKGLFFFGANGRQAQAWGNGSSFQCVVPPVKRASLLLGSGTTASCDGSFSQDLNALWCPVCPKPNHNPGAGVVVQAQLWYRDPLNTSNQTTSLSDAIEFSVGP